MNFNFSSHLRGMQKIGILGGGQLGRMLLQAAANYQVETHVMENDEDCPAAYLCRYFVKGNILDFDAVYAFGNSLDALTIEIENVNIEALEKLESEGVKIYPKPSVLRTITNKILQKKYYREFQIPTSDFIVSTSKAQIKEHADFLPMVQKKATGGYDGKGVQVLQDQQDLDHAWEGDSVVEKMVNIKKEIAVLIAVDQQNKTAIYPPVEMIFNKDLNLLDYQICPADLPQQLLWRVEAIAGSVVKNFNSPGLFAVELFVDDQNNVFVNETAPRVHNSGHHTIEAHYSSQFDMLWRIMLGFPLGNTKSITSSAMINIIGNDGFTGKPKYTGLEEVLSMDHAFIHLYGKLQTKPGRKMGHVTILSNEKTDLIYRANKIKQVIGVIADHELESQ